MREKFFLHGQRIFHTYELVEMLLYNTVVQRDTNPMAKSLLSRFGGAAGMLRASKEELIGVSGVGERTAELICHVGRADSVGILSSGARPAMTFDDYAKAGRFLTRYFAGREKLIAAIMLLDDAMRMLGIEEIETPRFDSGATRAKPFIDAALTHGATVAVIAFRHKGGMIYPFDSDVETCKMISAELAGVGVMLLESYVIGANSFTFAGPRHRLKSSATPEMERFSRTRETRDYADYDECDPLCSMELEVTGEDNTALSAVKDYLAELISYVGAEDCSLAADALVSRYGSLDNVLAQSADALAGIVGERAAHLVKLVGALLSRSASDGFALGSVHSDADIVRHLAALLYGSSLETVYLVSLDAEGRVRGCDFLGEGTANSSEIYQRRVAEVALRRRARSVIYVHNHPFGSATPSDDDLAATVGLYTTCRALGVRLRQHVIIAQREHFVLEPNTEDGSVNLIGRIC